MYVIFPSSYSFCATCIVCDTENPSLRPASCCSVDVVNGAAGDLVSGFFSTDDTVNRAVTHFSRNACTSSAVAKRRVSSAFSSWLRPSGLWAVKMAVTT